MGKSRAGPSWKEGDLKQRLETLEVPGRREIRVKRRTEGTENKKSTVFLVLPQAYAATKG